MGIKDLLSSKMTYVKQPDKALTSYLPALEAPVVPPNGPNVDIQKLLEAIAHNETRGVQGNAYAFSQPSGNPKLGNALGRYQVTEGELKSYGKKFLGQDITPQQYLASTTAQDNYMKGKANHYLNQGYTPQDVADIHRKGFKNSYPAGSGKYQSPDYVDSFNSVYNI